MKRLAATARKPGKREEPGEEGEMPKSPREDIAERLRVSGTPGLARKWKSRRAS